jgi:hypothetical protein
MTKEELVKVLTDAVGGTAYGDAIIDEAAATYGDKDKKYGQDIKDRLHEKLGVLKAYERIHRDASEDAKATAEAEKIATVKKALKALKAAKGGCGCKAA